MTRWVYVVRATAPKASGPTELALFYERVHAEAHLLIVVAPQDSVAWQDVHIAREHEEIAEPAPPRPDPQDPLAMLEPIALPASVTLTQEQLQELLASVRPPVPPPAPRTSKRIRHLIAAALAALTLTGFAIAASHQPKEPPTCRP
jgi:hypothetical protein